VATGADVLDLMRAVGGLHRALGAAGEAVAATAGLTHARAQCLREVTDQPLTVAEIASRLDVARQGVLRMADQLADEGFAAYVDNPRHRRAKLLTPTDEGRRALARMETAHREWVERTAPDLGDLDLPDLARRVRQTHDVVVATLPR
jgi:DNA-binding MarR family transcriptional regulator